MNDERQRDDDLRQLFRDARAADRSRTPEFRSVIGARGERASAPRRTLRLFVLSAATAAGALALVFASHLLVRESTEALETARLVAPLERRATPTPRALAAESPVPETATNELSASDPPAPVPPETPSPEPVQPAPVSPLPPPSPSKAAAAIEEYRARVEAAAERDRFSEEFIADLPVPGRFYRKEMTLAQGVQDPDGKADVHGSRNRNFQAVASGVHGTDATVRKRVIIRPNSIEELERITALEPEFNTEGYDAITENDFHVVGEEPVSTFSIDVDTASYSNVRRFLTGGKLPPANAVRIEELVNYFAYDYPQPAGEAPFSVSVEIAGCPWNPDHRLARIGLKGTETSREELPGSNLVFLLDVSGSMQPSNKLPLLKKAFKELVGQLDGRDRVAIVVYAEASGLVLPSTPGDRHEVIEDALNRLRAGGGTNGGAGLALAYEVARENFIPGGVNRVILATDGDFNLGITDQGEVFRLIEKDAKGGIFLTALGFGMGNYKDGRLEMLSGKGNGNYAYIDTLNEARKVLVDELGSTLVTIAKDVKIQVEFNPVEVGAYRLIGYENRLLNKEDFNDDRKDAGEIGAGHTVTALYELVPPGRDVGRPAVDALRYQGPTETAEAAVSGESLLVKLRYKAPDGDSSTRLEFPISDDGRSWDAASPDFKFAAAVAEFGMVLLGSEHRGEASLEQVRQHALEGIGPDYFGYRAEFLNLVAQAAELQ